MNSRFLFNTYRTSPYPAHCPDPRVSDEWKGLNVVLASYNPHFPINEKITLDCVHGYRLPPELDLEVNYTEKLRNYEYKIPGKSTNLVEYFNFMLNVNFLDPVNNLPGYWELEQGLVLNLIFL